MLILQLRREESVVVTLPDGRDARITYVRRGDSAKDIAVVGFDFPRDVKIMRQEAIDRLRRRKQDIEHGCILRQM